MKARPIRLQWLWGLVVILGCRGHSVASQSRPFGALAICEASFLLETHAFRLPLGTLSEADIQQVLMRRMTTCSALFTEPSCRAAWQDLKDHGTQAEKNEAIVDAMNACRTAYCPQFPDPRPTACDASVEHSWRELRKDILARDIGQTDAEVLEQLEAGSVRAAEQRLHSRASPGSGGSLTVSIDPTGFTLVTPKGNVAPGCNGTGPGVTVPVGAGSPPNYVALRACARKLKDTEVGGDGAVKIVVAPGVPYGQVVDCIDAIQKDDEGELFPVVIFGTGQQRL